MNLLFEGAGAIRLPCAESYFNNLCHSYGKNAQIVYNKTITHVAPKLYGGKFFRKEIDKA